MRNLVWSLCKLCAEMQPIILYGDLRRSLYGADVLDTYFVIHGMDKNNVTYSVWILHGTMSADRMRIILIKWG